jgi:creatinine amidohydrolase/Fe(II)-dependent formamide hydrolase-like protein
MRYELMLPHEVRQAIAQNWPVVLPIGVLEYHGEHLALGMDTLVITRCLDQLEAEGPIVILPPFYYGAASYAVAGPNGKGSLHLDAEVFLPMAKALFKALLKVGFRNIHGFVHHQTENFAGGMPTDLAFRLAARQVTFQWLEESRGDGWWGTHAMADYYEVQDKGDDPFNWIKIHPLMSAEIIEQYPFDHAGIGETSLMIALCPECVALDRLDPDEWYSASARDASQALGAKGRDMILDRLRQILWRLAPA